MSKQGDGTAASWVFNLHDEAQGIARKLAEGITTRIFLGDQAMLSVVRIAPHSQGTLHSHPEEQWGVLLNFTDQEIVDYRSTLTGDGDKSDRFTKLLRGHGVFKGEHKFYVSTAHDDDDVTRTEEAFASAIEEL